MHRYLKVLFLVLPFFMLACPAPKNSGVGVAGGGVEAPSFDNVSEVAGPNGSLWKGRGQGQDARYQLTFDMRQDGWTGVVRIEDSQATAPWDPMRKYEALFEGTSIESKNEVIFNVKYAGEGWHVQARLKVTGQGKGLGTVHIKENGLNLENVPMTQTKN